MVNASCRGVPAARPYGSIVVRVGARSVATHAVPLRGLYTRNGCNKRASEPAPKMARFLHLHKCCGPCHDKGTIEFRLQSLGGTIS